MSYTKMNWRNERNRKIRAKIFLTEDPKVYVLGFGPRDTMTVSLHQQTQHTFADGSMNPSGSLNTSK